MIHNTELIQMIYGGIEFLKSWRLLMPTVDGLSYKEKEAGSTPAGGTELKTILFYKEN